jgi:endonuclease YncB( thermonuclease family)
MYQYRVKEILKVIDGDTVDLIIDLGFNIGIKERVRLENINAPEVRTINEDEKKYGYQAKKKLEEYLDTDSNIIISTKKPDSTGKYGRVIADIYVEGKDLTACEYLLANHYVWPYFPANGLSELKDLSVLEDE